MIKTNERQNAMSNVKKLEIIGINKTFEKRKVLDDINFSVFDGEFLSILGPSGCGKTTMLRILIGLLSPDSGEILKNGVDITGLHPSKRNMGIVFQNYALFENMTVLQNVEYALKIDSKTKRNARESATSMLERMGLAEHANKKPHQLSGGQQQRVAIARTLVKSPEIILFDEPMSALDIATRLMLRDELKKIQKEFNTTMIYITHDQEEAFALSDRIMVMDNAKLIQIGTPEEIISFPANDYVKSFVIGNLQQKISSLSKYADYMKL